MKKTQETQLSLVDDTSRYAYVAPNVSQEYSGSNLQGSETQ